jgi:hypothetical protein
MSDNVQIAGMVISLVGTIFTGIMAYLMARLKSEQSKRSEEVAAKVDVAAHRVAEVKKTLSATTSNTEQKLDAIHNLVNGAMMAQKQITAVALRRVADVTKHPDDDAAAVIAETAYQEHLKARRAPPDGQS